VKIVHNKKQKKSMNTKWKIALLTILGFSTAACCTTKKAAKSEDKAPKKIEAEEEDPRIMLMYGVPFPDGQVARPVEEPAQAETDAKEFPNGAVAKPVTEEEAQKKLEAIKAEKEAKAAAEEANK
jgi:starvation-inducible outer membrane lipoprotein